METLPPKSWIIWRRGRLFYYLPPPKTEEFRLGWRPSKAIPANFFGLKGASFLSRESQYFRMRHDYIQKISEDVPTFCNKLSGFADLKIRWITDQLLILDRISPDSSCLEVQIVVRIIDVKLLGLCLHVSRDLTEMTSQNCAIGQFQDNDIPHNSLRSVMRWVVGVCRWDSEALTLKQTKFSCILQPYTR